MTHFHSDDYINFLKLISPGIGKFFFINSRLINFLMFKNFPDNMADYVRQLQRFNVGEDCPVFDGLFEFCQIYSSGSIGK